MLGVVLVAVSRPKYGDGAFFHSFRLEQIKRALDGGVEKYGVTQAAADAAYQQAVGLSVAQDTAAVLDIAARYEIPQGFQSRVDIRPCMSCAEFNLPHAHLWVKEEGGKDFLRYLVFRTAEACLWWCDMHSSSRVTGSERNFTILHGEAAALIATAARMTSLPRTLQDLLALGFVPSPQTWPSISVDAADFLGSDFMTARQQGRLK